MSTSDWLVVAIHLGFTLSLSAWLARGQRSPADCHVGARAMPWWALDARGFWMWWDASGLVVAVVAAMAVSRALAHRRASLQGTTLAYGALRAALRSRRGRVGCVVMYGALIAAVVGCPELA